MGSYMVQDLRGRIPAVGERTNILLEIYGLSGRIVISTRT